MEVTEVGVLTKEEEVVVGDRVAEEGVVGAAEDTLRAVEGLMGVRILKGDLLACGDEGEEALVGVSFEATDCSLTFTLPSTVLLALVSLVMQDLLVTTWLSLLVMFCRLAAFEGFRTSGFTGL